MGSSPMVGPTDGALASEPSQDVAWQRAVYGWLASQVSERTREDYHRDLGQWTDSLEEHAPVSPWRASRPLAAGWRHHLTAARGLAPATVARKLSACSSAYRFALHEGAADSNPFARLDRPKVSRDPAGVGGLDRAASRVLLAEARRAGQRDHGVICLLLNGLRAGELAAADVGGLDRIRGYRVLRTVAKGARYRAGGRVDRLEHTTSTRHVRAGRA